MKLPEFQTAYREARRDGYQQAVAQLQQGTSAAATTLTARALADEFALRCAAQTFSDEGHEVVALVARAGMSARASAEADRLLALN